MNAPQPSHERMAPARSDGALTLFALEGSRPFGERVAMQLGVTLAAHEERNFEDGEHKTRPLCSVRGSDVFVIHALHADAAQSPADKLCRLLFFIGALKDAAAARVTAVVPYLAYARKDQKSQPRDPVATRYVAQMFEAVGTDCVATLDVHNLAAFQNAFRCRTEHLEANRLFVEHFAPLLGEREAVAVAPDAGGIKRAERFRLALARTLGRPVAAAFFEKHRSEERVSGELAVGQIEGKVAIIIDDLIAAGTTLARTARGCRQRGALGVYAAASHGLFLGQAGTLLADAGLDRLAVCNSAPAFRLQGSALLDKLTVLDSTALFAQAILRMHDGHP